MRKKSMILLLTLAAALYPQSIKECCAAHDFARYLRGDTVFGADGAFDTTYSRIRVYFDRVAQSRDSSRTHPTCAVSGFDQLRGVVTPFSGVITLDTIYPCQNRPDCDTGVFFISGTYKFDENRTAENRGCFRGTLHFMFQYANGQPVRPKHMMQANDDWTNFDYAGTWRRYDNGVETPCCWAEGRKPDLPLGQRFDCGGAWFRPCGIYIYNGWEAYRFSPDTIFDTKYWWKLDGPKSRFARMPW